mmetsp:Transcript_1953/g.4436  ORF Transcript_1953/g.4436 Transcript_1953/m.4436 type:complete len:86 (+) Transcript_1953:838-1095(+)
MPPQSHEDRVWAGRKQPQPSTRLERALDAGDHGALRQQAGVAEPPSSPGSDSAQRRAQQRQRSGGVGGSAVVAGASVEREKWHQP